MGGGPLFSVEAKGMPEFQGEENITVYHSSEWAERAFCRECDSHLLYRLTEDMLYYNMPVGLFEELTDLEFKTQIYIDKKPCYYNFANQTKNMTEAEVIAMFASQQ